MSLDAVDEAFRALLQSGIAVITGGLEPCAATGGMSFTCELRTPQPNAAGLPPTAAFKVVVPQAFPESKVDVIALDDAVRGFAHQGTDGAICLKTDDYPSAAPGRLLAFVNGVIAWLADAANGHLLGAGQPWELPDFRPLSSATPILLLESEEAFALWAARVGESGSVDLALHRGARALVAVRFYREGGVVTAPFVSPSFCEAARSAPAEWLMLASFVVGRHRRPRTFGELAELGARRGIEVWQPLHRALKHPSIEGYHYLLVGAPIPHVVGQPAVEVHWQPIAIPASLARVALAGSTTAGGAIRRESIKARLRDEPIPWAASENVAGARMLKRGALSEAARVARVCMFGCGAVGSVVADHLARGGAHNLSLFDRERLEIQNLVRHTLQASDVGGPKAVALAARLQGIHPGSLVRAFPLSVPPDLVTDNIDARAVIKAAEVIIDCTADDVVLRWASRAGRETGAKVISIYTNAGASMLTISMSGRHVRCSRVDDLLHADIRAGRTPFSFEEYSPDEEVRPGAGCWSATSPARGSDIMALVSAAMPVLEELIAREKQSRGPAYVLRRPPLAPPFRPRALVELAWSSEYR